MERNLNEAIEASIKINREYKNEKWFKKVSIWYREDIGYYLAIYPKEGFLIPEKFIDVGIEILKEEKEQTGMLRVLSESLNSIGEKTNGSTTSGVA